MNRSDIINKLISLNNYKSYLEIGVNTQDQPGHNWPSIEVDIKHGVDPNVDTTYRMTSDEFFDNHISRKYDFIFVDGLHLFDQCYKDIINSLDNLNVGGTIMVHDTNPVQEITQRPQRVTSSWHGDVWKAIVKLRTENAELQLYTIDTDEGCTIINRGEQELLVVEPDTDLYDFSFLEKHRVEAINLISVDTFLKKYERRVSV